MKKQIEAEIKKNPLRIYDTILFLSAQNGGANDQDFAMMGDTFLIAQHFAVMLNRHEKFREVVALGLQFETLANEALNAVKEEG